MVLTCIARATSNLSLCDVSAQAGLESAQETSGARGGKYKPVGRYAIYCIVGTSGTFFCKLFVTKSPAYSRLKGKFHGKRIFVILVDFKEVTYPTSVCWGFLEERSI